MRWFHAAVVTPRSNHDYYSHSSSSTHGLDNSPVLEPLWLVPRKGTGFDHFDKKHGTEQNVGGDNKAGGEEANGGGGGNSGGNKNNKNSGGDNNGNNNNNMYSQIFSILALSVALYLVSQELFPSDDDNSAFASREVTWNDLIHQLVAGDQIQKIVVAGSTARIILKPGAPGVRKQESTTSDEDAMDMGLSKSPSAIQPFQQHQPHRLRYRMALGNVDTLERKLDEAQRNLGIPPERHVPVQFTNDSTVLGELSSLAVVLGAIAMTILLMRVAGMGGSGGRGGAGGGMGGIFQVGKSTAKKINKEDISTTFNDVAGCQEAKKEIMEFVDFLQDPMRFTKLGAKIPKGALLCGPPGTGKTLLAKAVAGEAGVPFYSVSGSDFIEMFVGVGPSRVRDLFKEARANAPCIIFIDEIDAVGRQRGRGGVGGNDERENTLNQLLVEMDGFSPSTGVVVLAGTNRIDILDSALTRPGRFDRTIQVDKPDLQGRKEIFMVHLRGLTLEDEAEEIAGRLAGLTPGFAGADIANICNEAAIVAARRAADSVSMHDFEAAIDRVIGGMESNKIMSKAERSIVAHHEAGHAVAGWFLEHADPLLKVTIIPRTSGALGFAQYLPKEIVLRTQAQIMDIVCMALAGRAAEEIFFGRVTTGASDDLRRVTDLVYSTIQVYGMNPRLGQLAFPKDPNAMFDERPYSDATAMAMDEEAKTIVDEAYQRTLNLLRDKKDQVEQVAAMLLTKETITHDDILELVGPRPFKGDKQYEQYIKRNQNLKEKEVDGSAEVTYENGPLTPGLA
jgi:AFG3 family protein